MVTLSFSSSILQSSCTSAINLSDPTLSMSRTLRADLSHEMTVMIIVTVVVPQHAAVVFGHLFQVDVGKTVSIHSAIFEPRLLFDTAPFRLPFSRNSSSVVVPTCCFSCRTFLI